ncbi:ABC transporter ATP-binding protein [Luteimonas sp. A478]
MSYKPRADSPAESDLAISAVGLSKCYNIFERPSHRLLQGLLGDSRKLYREFWALRDISFEVRRGETLGIVGRNGSGKSTLLQLLAGTLTATQGSVEVNGKVAALLELGSGFNPEFTGRENVYMNAAILGLTKAQIDARIQLIEEFAEIGEFIDQPVRSYSSGMVMRLAFAVMAHVEAEILIIDEALSVGDAFFTQKCMRFLRNFKQHGTLLFVSHDDGAVTGLCDRAIWLESGRMKAEGDAKAVMSAYLETLIAQRQGGVLSADAAKPSEARVRRDPRQDLINHSNIRNDLELAPFDPEGGFGAMDATLESVGLCDREGNELAWVVGGELARLQVDVIVNEPIDKPIVGFYLKDRLGQLLFGDNTYLSTLDCVLPGGHGQRYVATFEFVMPRLQAGDYFVTVGVSSGTQESHVVQHWIHEAIKITARGANIPAGIMGIPMESVKLEAKQ